MGPSLIPPIPTIPSLTPSSQLSQPPPLPIHPAHHPSAHSSLASHPSSHPPQPEMPVPTDVLNQLASSVHLSSIQSLVDLLLELPLPRETCLPSQNQPLITPHQEQQHLSNNIEQELVQQHHLSLQLSSGLRQARQQLQELNLNWINESLIPVNEGNIEFSRHQQLNSYLLSLLQQQDIFGHDVRLPPVIHKQPTSNVPNAIPPMPPSQCADPTLSLQYQNTAPTLDGDSTTRQVHPGDTGLRPDASVKPTRRSNSQSYMVPSPSTASQSTPTGPQTRSHASHQPYWNPFINEQQQQKQPSSTSPSGYNQQQPVPPPPPTPQQQQQQPQQPYNRHLNQMYSNDNSNSNSSFPEIGSATPGTPSTPSYHSSVSSKIISILISDLTLDSIKKSRKHS